MTRMMVGTAAFFSSWVLVAVAVAGAPVSDTARAVLERGAELNIPGANQEFAGQEFAGQEFVGQEFVGQVSGRAIRLSLR